MLQKVDTKTMRLLALADYIEQSDDFHQGNWHTCICGQARKMLKASKQAYGRSPPLHMAWGSQALGLSYDQASELFSNNANPTRMHAARVLRNFAVTGEVDWTRQYHWFWGWEDAPERETADAHATT